MEKAVEVLFTDRLLGRFLELYQLEADTKKLGDFENYVFEVKKKSEPYILRITHSSHRTGEEIAAELDWIGFLRNENISVPQVFQSINHKTLEELPAEDGSFFYGCLFSKAVGEPVKIHSHIFNEHLFHTWGRTLGQMHAATKKYTVPEDIKARPRWDEDDLLNIEHYFPAEDGLLVQHTVELLGQLQILPVNKDTFGLVHTDVHSGNFFFDGETVNVFDFDDCSYHWFTSDIAIPLYYSVMHKIPADQQAQRDRFAAKFITAFAAGYEKANSLPAGWKEHMPLFLKLRDILLYAVFHKKIAPSDRNERITALLSEIGERIRRKQPIVNL
ncbi:phosphotransferase enzyme family protein [Bacillus sp. T33-2]|uniref:phosphotransferase enzyme family protein n=1 Tax=Bacillus sp. T33-2 TaxID=2054168 RepID=UPI000C788B16|nr:phosphotransferase [Bacillus sp. T33-2]PLR97494.1 hypothetical protein CVD19_08370 [Bacillus sp. T33-2]